MNKCYVGLLFNFFIARPCISTLLLFSSTASALNIQMQAAGQMPPIKLNDNSLKNQALANGNTGEPKLTINKNSEQCPTAYKLYKCNMFYVNKVVNSMTENNTVGMSFQNV